MTDQFASLDRAALLTRFWQTRPQALNRFRLIGPPEYVQRIRQMTRTHSQAEIARIVGVSDATVSRVVNGKSWKEAA